MWLPVGVVAYFHFSGVRFIVRVGPHEECSPWIIAVNSRKQTFASFCVFSYYGINHMVYTKFTYNGKYGYLMSPVAQEKALHTEKIQDSIFYCHITMIHWNLSQ